MPLIAREVLAIIIVAAALIAVSVIYWLRRTGRQRFSFTSELLMLVALAVVAWGSIAILLGHSGA